MIAPPEAVRNSSAPLLTVAMPAAHAPAPSATAPSASCATPERGSYANVALLSRVGVQLLATFILMAFSKTGAPGQKPAATIGIKLFVAPNPLPSTNSDPGISSARPLNGVGC